MIASAPQPDDLRRSSNPKDREVLRDRFCEETPIDHRSKIELFGRLVAAADACLVEQADATAHLVCAAVLREAYAAAKQMDERDQITDNLTFTGQRTGYFEHQRDERSSSFANAVFKSMEQVIPLVDRMF